VNWYEWLDAVLTVFCKFVFEFGVWVKISRFFMGREDPIDFYINCVFCLLFFVDFYIFCWSEGKIKLTLACFVTLTCVFLSFIIDCKIKLP
jgi:hypothetical protein